MSDLRAYQIEEKAEGRAGWVFYVEQGRLPLPYEILGVPGRGVEVPPAEEWDEYCEKHGSSWAKGRRDEIVQRVAKGLLKKWYGSGSYEVVEGRWLNIYPGPSLLSRLLDKMG